LKTKIIALLLLVWLPFAPVSAQALLPVCFNYDCAQRAIVSIAEEQLRRVHTVFDMVMTAEDEREALRLAVAELYRIAATQTPIGADRAGNLRDNGVDGRMDCIDHSNTTTAMLRLIEERGWLRFHRVLQPVRRNRLIFQHFSAAVEMRDGEVVLLIDGECEHARRYCRTLQMDGLFADGGRERRFVVDTWYVEQGEPAVVMPVSEWLKGGGPDGIW